MDWDDLLGDSTSAQPADAPPPPNTINTMQLFDALTSDSASHNIQHDGIVDGDRMPAIVLDRDYDDDVAVNRCISSNVYSYYQRHDKDMEIYSVDEYMSHVVSLSCNMRAILQLGDDEDDDEMPILPNAVSVLFSWINGRVPSVVSSSFLCNESNSVNSSVYAQHKKREINANDEFEMMKRMSLDSDIVEIDMENVNMLWESDVITCCAVECSRIEPFDFSIPSPDDLCLAAQANTMITKDIVVEANLEWRQQMVKSYRESNIAYREDGTVYSMTVEEMLAAKERLISERIAERDARARASALTRSDRDMELQALKEQREGTKSTSAHTASERRRLAARRITGDKYRNIQRDKKTKRLGV